VAPDRIGLHLCLALALAACGGDAEAPAAAAPDAVPAPGDCVTIRHSASPVLTLLDSR